MFYYYIHNNNEGIYNKNSSRHIQVNNHSAGEILFIENVFKKVDDLIDLDFKRVYDENISDISFFKANDSQKLLGNDNTEGFTEKMKEGGDSWINIWWKNWDPDNNTNFYTEYDLLSEQESFTIVHELGHALGLAHPRNLPEAEWHNTTDTVMSYNFKSVSGNKALNFTDNDLSTLKILWGEENDSPANSSVKTSSNNLTFDFTGISSLGVKRELPKDIDFKISSSILNTADKDPITGVNLRNSELENHNYINNQMISNNFYDIKKEYSVQYLLEEMKKNQVSNDHNILLEKYKNEIFENSKKYSEYNSFLSESNDNALDNIFSVETENEFII